MSAAIWVFNNLARCSLKNEILRQILTIVCFNYCCTLSNAIVCVGLQRIQFGAVQLVDLETISDLCDLAGKKR
jgi:hypothetical protein